MLFSSPIFLFLFLPFVVTIYFILPNRLKNGFLFIASILFYTWGETGYVFLILFSIGVNYIFAKLINGALREGTRKIYLISATATNIGCLIFFKYIDFIILNINSVLSVSRTSPIPLLNMALPIGISFFTFQALSYIVDVYFNKVKVQHNILNLGMYIAMFPQLIAGPIVRYGEVEDCLGSRKHDWRSTEQGLIRFIMGLGKKVILANTFAAVADDVFAVPSEDLTFQAAWIGIFAYTCQIYYDFSGYSDMAIGLGRMFGFRFPENFRFPYSAVSIQDFWRRWHISLSTWFRDYLYIPLGGNRKGNVRTYVNLLIVFTLCGIWHGANWTFLLWGLWHGVFLVLERMGFSLVLKKCFSPVKWGYTMLIVMIGWVLFRSDTLGFASGYLYAMTGFQDGNEAAVSIYPYLSNVNILTAILGILFSFPISDKIDDWIKDRGGAPHLYSERITSMFTYASCIAVLAISASSLAAGTYNPFIYFRF